jgi:hypothetical protein
MALLLIAWTTGPVRADCPAAPIAHPDDMAISFLAANGVQAASASLLASSVKEGTLVYDDTANNLQVCNGTNWVAVGTGTGGIAGGGASEVQFRDSGTGAFAADSAFRYDPAAHILTISPNPATLSQAPFTNTVLHLSNVDGSAPRLLMEAFSNGSTTTPNVSMRSANGTGVAPLALRNEDILGQLTFTGHNGTSFALARSAIRGTATEDWTPTANGADLRFHTTPNGTADVIEAMRIANDGNVGIGTAIAPIVSGGTGRTSLSIKGASEGGVLELVSGAADTDPATVGLIQFSNPNFMPATSQKTRVAAIAVRSTGATVGDRGGVIEFHTKRDGDFLALRMVIDGNGNVGIGTTTPAYNLDVNGAINGTSVLINGVPVASSTDTYWSSGGAGKIYYSGGNVGVGTTAPSNLVSVGTDIGSVAAGGPTALVVGSTTGASQVVVGQSNTRNLQFNWQYNATPANAYGLIQTWGGGNNLVLQRDAGNIGIGTTTPQSRLQVAGGIQLADDAGACPGASNTKLGALKYVSDDLSVCKSTGWTALGAGGGGSSNGTAGYVQFSGGSGAFASDSTAGEQFFWNSTNHRLGIGTTSPEARLMVHDSGAVDNTLAFTFTDNEQPASLGALGEVFGGSMTHNFRVGHRDVAFINRNFSSQAGNQGFTFAQQTGTGTFSTLMMMDGDSGNVGIGTAGPSAKLDVSGTAIFGTGGGEWLMLRAGGDLIINDSDGTGALNAYNDSGISYIRSDDGGSAANGSIDFNSGRMRLQGSTGNVGIGTTSPGYPLQVASGSAAFPTALGIIPTTHATSRRAALTIDDWLLLQDAVGNGTKDFGIWQSGVGLMRMFIGTNGDIGIGTASPNQGKVEVKGGSVCVDTNSDDNATSCITAESDVRLKKNIEVIPNALGTLGRLRGVLFDWRWDEYPQIKDYKAIGRDAGVIAQEVEAAFPQGMGEEVNGFKTVRYDRLVPLLIESVKELKADNDNLRAELEASNDNYEDLRREVEALKR